MFIGLLPFVSLIDLLSCIANLIHQFWTGTMEIITKQFVINVIKCIFDVLDTMSANLAGQ